MPRGEPGRFLDYVARTLRGAADLPRVLFPAQAAYSKPPFFCLFRSHP